MTVSILEIAINKHIGEWESHFLHYVLVSHLTGFLPIWNTHCWPLILHKPTVANAREMWAGEKNTTISWFLSSLKQCRKYSWMHINMDMAWLIYRYSAMNKVHAPYFNIILLNCLVECYWNGWLGVMYLCNYAS